MELQSAVERVQRIYDVLDQSGRQSLVDYAEFLLQRSGAEIKKAVQPSRSGVYPAPVFEEAPEDETITGAMTRLSRVYQMLDVEAMLAQASLSILDGAAMREKTSRQLIDELENFYAERYRRAKLLA